MSRIQKISRGAAAFGALVFALALALAFSFSANGNAHADVKPSGTIEDMQQVASNPTYDGTPQRGYGGTPYCTYTDDDGAVHTYTGPFTVTYTGTVHAGTADERPYGPTSTPPMQAGSYQVELSLPGSAPCTAAPSARSFIIERAPLAATVSPDDENATRPYDYSETPTFTDIKLGTFTGLVPADEGKVDITATGDALKQDGTGVLVPDANVITDDGTPAGKPTGKPFKATSVSYNNPTSCNYDLQTGPDAYNVSGEVMIVKKPMPDYNDGHKNEVYNKPGASWDIPVSPLPNGSTHATYTIVTDILRETQGLSDATIVKDADGEVKLKVTANGEGDDAYDKVKVRVSELENHGDYNVTLQVQYRRDLVKAIEGVTALPSPVEYDGQPHAGFKGTPTAYYIDYQGNRVDYGTSPDETFAFSYTGTAADGTRYDSTTPPTNAGTYQVTIAIAPHHVCMGSTTFDFAIVQRPASVTWMDTLNRIHGDGKEVTAHVVGAVTGTDVSLTVTGGNETDAGTHRATAVLAGADRSNYVIQDGSDSVSYTIGKAAAFDLSTTATALVGGQTTVDLSSLPGLPSDLGPDPVQAATTFTENGLAGAQFDAASGKLTLTASSNVTTGATDTVRIALSGMTNYENSTIVVAVQYEKASATIGGIDARNAAYDGSPHAGYTGTPTAAYRLTNAGEPLVYNGPFDISYTGTAADGTAYGPVSTPPTAAGIYRATFALPLNAPCTGQPAVLDFDIDKASLVFRALDTTMTVGDTLPPLGYAAEGLADSDHVIQEPRLSVAGDTTAAGSLAIAIDGGIVDNQACYNVSYAGGTLTVNAVPKPEPAPEPPAKPEPKPLPKPTAEPEAEAAIPATGDNALPELLVCAAGAAVLAIGIAAGRRRRNERE